MLKEMADGGKGLLLRNRLKQELIDLERERLQDTGGLA
jgi:hypothetical protein